MLWLRLVLISLLIVLTKSSDISTNLYEIYEKYNDEHSYNIINRLKGYDCKSKITSLSFVYDIYQGNSSNDENNINNIDDVVYYVINLDRRIDRLKYFLDAFYQAKLPSKYLYRLSAIEHYYGPLGCVLSHLVLLYDFLIYKTANNVVIFEDDIKFYDHTLHLGEYYNQKVIYNDLYNHNDWDLILLTPSRYIKVNGTYLFEYLDYDHQTKKYKSTNNDDLLFKIRPDHSTSSNGYITKRRYVQKIIENMINTYTIMVKFLEHMPTKYLEEAALDRQWLQLANKIDSQWYVLKLPISDYNLDYGSDIANLININNRVETDISSVTTDTIDEIVLHVPITIKGLGRHLFIVWAAISYARKNNLSLSFWDMKKKPWKSFWDTFFKNIEFYYKPWPSSSYYAYRDPNDFVFESIPRFDSSFTLSGYFQSHKYFDDIYNDIYSTLVTRVGKSYSDEADNIFNLIKSYSGKRKCIFVHINQKIKIMDTTPSMNLNKEYYIKAITHFDSENFFVFLSNPRNESNREFVVEVENEIKQYTGNYIFMQNEKYDNYVMMLAMIRMDGAIIANSAYSWWIAYLMDNYRNKTVVIPRIWYNNDIVQVDKKLDHWVFP